MMTALSMSLMLLSLVASIGLIGKQRTERGYNVVTEPCSDDCNHMNTYDLPDRIVQLNQDVYDTINEQFTTKDSGERQQFDSGMQRDVTEGKTKWHLIASGPMLKRWAELMTRGAEKYDDDNWMKANSFDEYARFRQSAFRHFMQWYMGHEDEDHAAAVIFNINGTEYVKEKVVA